MNRSGSTLEYNGIQSLILWTIATLFILFITLFIPDKHRVVEVLIFLIGVPLMGILVVSTAINLRLLYNLDVWKSIIGTAIVVLLIPSIMTVIYYSHYNSYLTAIPENNRVAFRITADVKYTGGSGNVGNEWLYKHAINNTAFEDGEIVEVNVREPFIITSTITEIDGIDDIGLSTSEEYHFKKQSDYTEELVITNSVKVVERGGRKNSGAYATFSVKYHINRVLPADFTFFDVYFFADNQTERVLLWGVLFLGLGSILYVVFLIRAGKKREDQLAIERKAEEERKFQSERNAFITRLGGKRLRDVAGVPLNITYRDGKPVDNNNSE